MILVKLLSIISDKIRDGLGDKKADFISLICRVIGGLVFAFIKGTFDKFMFVRPDFQVRVFRMEISVGFHFTESIDDHCFQHHHARESNPSR